MLALVGSALVLEHQPEMGAPGSQRRPAVAPARDALAGQVPGSPAEAGPSVRLAVAGAARAFLPAYLSYEVGDLRPASARALRASATPEFGDALLGAPPRSTAAGRPPDAARLRRLRIKLVPGSPSWADLNATARRGGHQEGLSFVFELRGGRWLAAGVGE